MLSLTADTVSYDKTSDDDKPYVYFANLFWLWLILHLDSRTRSLSVGFSSGETSGRDQLHAIQSETAGNQKKRN